MPYTQRRANMLKVIIKPSTKKSKKLDVFDKKGNFLVSIGNYGSLDYAYYLYYVGVEKAEERKRLYKIRHQKDRLVKGTAGYYSDQLLWT
jgi:hypothetical protein